MRVGLVLVSHSGGIARGLAELARQMAPAVAVVPAGGDDHGGLGTSFALVGAALDEADRGAGVVVLYDLGSALLTTETALELGDPRLAGRCRVVDAPLVEGALAAAVAAQHGGDLEAVAQAARRAAQPWAQAGPPDTPAASDVLPGEDEPAPEEVVREVVLVDPAGLHARPAAVLAREVRRSPAGASVSRPGGPAADLTSVLSVVGLALRGGERIRLAARGEGATALVDRLAGLIAGGLDDAPAARPGGQVAHTDDDGCVHATAGAPGLALAPVLLLGGYPPRLPRRAVRAADVNRELQRLMAAVEATAQQLDWGTDLEQAHAALLRDPRLLAGAAGRLQHGAAHAWWAAVQELAVELEMSVDDLVRHRAADVRDAGAAVLGRLGASATRVSRAVDGQVVVADDLGPAEVTRLVEHGCAGVVLRRGSATGHAVVVARGLGLPVVLGAGDELSEVGAGTLVLLDGESGTVRIDPSEAQAAAAAREILRREAVTDRLRREAALPVRVAGRRVLVAANIGSLADAHAAVRAGADAVGLLRTELLLLERSRFPTEEEQVDDLRRILEVVGERPVVVRVLDVGGDKSLTGLGLDPVRHGFLGLRGLRYLLQHPGLLHTQLRAVARASPGHRVSVMAPMVTTEQEAGEFRRAVQRAVSSLAADGLAHEPPRAVGVMIETPAAALTVDEIAPVVDFVSIGSNDLLSYTMAAERTAPEVAHLLDDRTPALTRLLDRVVRDAGRRGVPVSVCGELAGQAGHAVRLVRQGVGELSMVPSRVPEIKAALRGLAQVLPQE